MAQPKRTFLCVYDYGTGGVWALISARSKTEVNRVFPEFEVVDQRPSWLTDEEYAKLELRLDVDDRRPGWLVDPQPFLDQLLARSKSKK